MLISNNKHEVGDEIDCGIHGRGREDYRVTIRKVSSDEWIAYKFPFRTKREVVLRRGDLRKIVGYVNRNFGYNDEVADVHRGRIQKKN